MSPTDYPPDDFILHVTEWLKGEIYPGLLDEPWTDRAHAVWVDGSNGFVGLWVGGFASGSPPHDRLELIKHELYKRIYKVKFPPEKGVNFIDGQLRVEGLTFRDNRGLVRPLFCHFGEAFSAFCRRPDDVILDLQRIKDAGYHGIRFWDVLGYYDRSRPGDPNQWTAWAGREVSPIGFTQFSGAFFPGTPDYYQKLKEFLTILKDMGLKAHHSRGDLNSWAWNSIRFHCEEVGNIQRTVGPDVIALNESLNEAWQNGVPGIEGLRQMGDFLGNHALRGNSCGDDGYGGETPEELNRLKRDVAIVHGYRGGDSRNRIGHIHAVGYETLPAAHVPGWQGEPAGPGSGVSVGREESEEALILMAAMSLMTRQAWVYMSSNGVFWNGSISEMTGFWSVPRILEYLPLDIMTFDQIIHGGDTWRGKRVFVANASGTMRADQALAADGRVVALIYGSGGSWEVPVERKFEGVSIEPITGNRSEVVLNPGDTLNLFFDRGRILVGRTF